MPPARRAFDRRRLAGLALAAALTWLAGCGAAGPEDAASGGGGGSAGGAAVLAWDANNEADLAGYRVYVGLASGAYSTSIDVGTVTSYTLTGLATGTTYYFAVTAYDTSGNESAPSNEVSKPIL